jgi:lipoprotein LprG
MIARRALAVALTVGLCLLSGCTSSSSTAVPATTAPPAAELLATSATAMSSVTSANFTITVDGQLPAVTIKSAEGTLTAAGDAKGTATITQLGQLLEVEFVLVGGNLYLKGATGGFTQVPAALAGGLYDPSAILDPDKGVAKMLSSVTGATNVGTDGDAWVVTGTVPVAVAGGLVPGISTDVAGTFTIDMATSQLTAAQFELPGADGKPATVKVDLSDFNQSVSISPPGG